MTTTRDYITAVQHSALERALVDGDDARRYFALAGTMEAVNGDPANGTLDGEDVRRWDDTDDDLAGVLPAALLSLSIVPLLADSEPTPAVSTTTTPWTVGGDPTRTAIRRGAQLAVRWFDVSPKQVAARAGLPEAVLTTPDD